MKRPTGFTILALFLAWVGIAGFVKVAIQFNSDHGTILMTLLAFLYGTTALATTIGLWKLKEWSYKSFIVWSIVVVAMMLTFQFGEYGMYRASMVPFLVFSVLVISLLYVLARYIKKNLTTSI